MYSSSPHKNPHGSYIRSLHIFVSIFKWRMDNPKKILPALLIILHVDHIENNHSGQSQFRVYNNYLMYNYKLCNKEVIKTRSNNTT